MKRFFAFVKKEFLHIFRDRRTLVILFGIPIVQLLLFGYALTNEVRNVKVVVADYAHDVKSREIIGRLQASPWFQLVGTADNPNQYESILRSGKAKEIVVIEHGFAQKLVHDRVGKIQLIADASEPNTAQLIINYTTAIINGAPPASMIEVKTRMLYNENMKEAYNFIPGLMAMILMLISAMMTAITITREKEMGTMEILLASPLKPIQIILGKVTPYMILSLINAIIIVGLGTTLFGVPIKGSLMLLMFEVMLFIFLALSLGILISTIAANQMAAMAISGFGLMLPTILLSGFIFPIKNMPLPLQIISNLMPPRWFIEINRMVMLKGADITLVWKQTLILMVMSAVFIFISMKKFKIRLE